MLTEKQEEQVSRAYDTYGAMLYRIGLMHTGNPAEAEDVLQDVFLRLLAKAPRFRDELHEKRWLARVAVNLCHNRRRSAAARTNVPIPETLATREAASDGAVKDAVRALPPKLRDVVYFHCVKGYSVEETAKLLKIGVSAAKMRLSRARAKGKGEIGAEDENEEPPDIYQRVGEIWIPGEDEKVMPLGESLAAQIHDRIIWMQEQDPEKFWQHPGTFAEWEKLFTKASAALHTGDADTLRLYLPDPENAEYYIERERLYIDSFDFFTVYMPAEADGKLKVAILFQPKPVVESETSLMVEPCAIAGPGEYTLIVRDFQTNEVLYRLQITQH
ncbi:MAG: RNA polymerase sigma factor [Oscillospiraceae bacterium]|jgi:RNA polymerase sigma-70 factor (ECF subfamily)|nr:RNA polymerase sigma factor [Oscillospiraceae bacterium]